jgi:hypothetical protein
MEELDPQGKLIGEAEVDALYGLSIQIMKVFVI